MSGSAVEASPYAPLFDAADHSDVRLCVYTDIDEAKEPSAKKAKRAGASTDSAPGTPARTYHCHAVVLSVMSGYFQAQLSLPWRQPEGSSSGQSPEAACTRSVDIHVEAGELDALHEVLQMLYSQTLPAVPPTAPLFLQCVKLADRLRAVSCMELLVGGLAALPSADIDHTLLSYVFQAPPGVCISHAYTSLLESCGKAVVRLFGDVPKDEALLQRFCSLPHAAVLAWAKSDDLQVHSENCVVFLVSAWVQANKGSTAAQHEELAHQTRVFDLGPTYLHHLLATLSWFKDCIDMEYLPAVQAFVRAGIKSGEELEAGKRKVSKSLALPPGWLAKPRKRSGGSHTCSWVLSSSQLEELDAGQALESSCNPSPFYVNGFMLMLKLKLMQPRDSSAATPGKTLGIFRGTSLPDMKKHGVSVSSKAMVGMGAISLKVGSPGSEKRSEHNFVSLLNEAGLMWGDVNALTTAAPTVLELVGPYLHDGQLHVNATIAAMDT